jgi:acyl dehydratase
MTQRTWQQVEPGEDLAPVAYPLSTMRLVLAAGANRDFNSIHHDADFARASGAPDSYANTFFLQGMWERCVRGYIGPAGTIRGLSGFAMKAFSTPGQTVTVAGRVERKWMEGEEGLVEIAIHSRTASGVTVGPGRMLVSLPLR